MDYNKSICLNKKMPECKRQKVDTMSKSMTGFGRAECSGDRYKFTVEMKSVNHRYLDVNIRMPKKCSPFEAEIRACLKQYLQRGKVDVFISYEEIGKNSSFLKYDEALAKTYLSYLEEMQKLGIENKINTYQLARMPEVITMVDDNSSDDSLWDTLKVGVLSAVENLQEARSLEGKSLVKDLNQKLIYLSSLVEEIKQRSPQIMEDYKKRLEEKLAVYLEDVQVDPNRLAAELVLFSDKICTDEEVVRLESHIQHMQSELKKDEAIGRKLDFIAQEMNRESNTILSKANDLTISNIAIDLKTEIEKIREQIQNIE